ncbi:hypothetical protein JBL43_11320 [Aureibaculum sp. A20]|uniref:WG repeat-containing protein n=1 Tax=Aureibaculum flavum TaxID=2795986 RepID=A0ABS0WS74_9FLAO|nr:hypothetical protein [Aureibaculum flavum]MBJ2174830.1 hypothetical protein [Aureibaculum flavum]
MKKYIYITTLLLFSISCKPQNRDLQEAEIELEEKIKSAESLLNFMDSNIVFAPADQVQDDSLKIYFQEASGLKDTLEIKKAINKYLDSLYLREDLQYPSNYITFDYYDGKFGNIIGYSSYYYDNEKENPVFLLKKVVFKDKTVLVTNDTLKRLTKSSSNIGVRLKQSKPVEKLEVEVNYQYPVVEKFNLGKDNTKLTFPEGEIILKNIEKNKVTLIMPKSIEERLVVIDALYKDGRVMQKHGMSGGTLPSKETLSFLKTVMGIQKNALKKLKNNEFKDKAELETFIKKNIPAEPLETEPYYTATYRYSGNVSSINIFISKQQNILGKKNLVVQKSYLSKRKDQFGYFISTDSITKKDGLVGIDGKWKIQPNFNELSSLNYYYYGGYLNGSYQLYLLDLSKNNLTPVSYSLFESDLYHNTLVIVERKSLRGVVDAKTGKVIIPIEHKYIWAEKDLFKVKNQSNKVEYFDKNGKQVSP